MAQLPAFWNDARGQSKTVGVNKGSVKQPDRGKSADQYGQPDKRGTKDLPFVVDTEGHQKTKDEQAKADAEKQHVRNVESDTLLYARLAAWATVALVIIGSGGVWAALRTLQAIEREFELSHRPWVAVGVTITAPIVTDSDWTHVTVTCALRNTGNSPAIRTTLHITIDASWEQNQVDSNWKKFCEKPVPLSEYVSVTLFPGEPYLWEEPFHIARTTIKENRDPVEDTFSRLTIMGRVGYEYSFAEGQHTTPFIYEIVEDNGSRDPRIQLPKIGSGQILKGAIKLVPHITLFRQTIESQAT
jgi:hypothetical protein